MRIQRQCSCPLPRLWLSSRQTNVCWFCVGTWQSGGKLAFRGFYPPKTMANHTNVQTTVVGRQRVPRTSQDGLDLGIPLTVGSQL